MSCRLCNSRLAAAGLLSRLLAEPLRAIWSLRSYEYRNRIKALTPELLPSWKSFGELGQDLTDYYCPTHAALTGAFGWSSFSNFSYRAADDDFVQADARQCLDHLDGGRGMDLGHSSECPAFTLARLPVSLLAPKAIGFIIPSKFSTRTRTSRLTSPSGTCCSAPISPFRQERISCDRPGKRRKDIVVSEASFYPFRKWFEMFRARRASTKPSLPDSVADDRH